MHRKLQSNWILSYSDAVDKMSEAPTSFNVWMAVSVISAALKKRVWIKRGLYKIYANQYIVLVSPPGIGKGSAIHPAHAFVKEPRPMLANYMSDRITAPKIIERLAAGFANVSVVNGVIQNGLEASCVLQATELATFLGSSDWMTSFLCDAWDRGEFEYDTKGKGTFLIKDMCVSLVGACVPEFIRTINRDGANAINGGFTARTLFVFANDKSKSLVWPVGFDGNVNTQRIAADLAHDLAEIARLNGEFTWTPTAKYTFEKFYNSVATEENDTDVVRHFKARKTTHVLKVAMCFSAAGRDDLVIGDYELNTAIALVNNVEQTLDITFRGVGESPLAEATARIQSYVERKGYVSRGEILRDNYRHITSEDLDRVLMVLESINFMKREIVSGKVYYKHNSIGNNGNHKP